MPTLNVIIIHYVEAISLKIKIRQRQLVRTRVDEILLPSYSRTPAFTNCQCSARTLFYNESASDTNPMKMQQSRAQHST